MWTVTVVEADGIVRDVRDVPDEEIMEDLHFTLDDMPVGSVITLKRVG